MIDSQFGLGIPGVRETLETIENSPWWGGYYQDVIAIAATIAGTTRDASHTNRTWHLRPGTIMALGDDLKWHVYDPTATDSKSIAAGILPFEMKMIDNESNSRDLVNRMIIAGQIRPDALYGFDQAARSALSERGFRFGFFRDGAIDPIGTYMAVRPRGRIAKTANFTVLATQHGIEFTNAGASGAVTFTLPALSTAAINGTVYWFTGLADQNITVAAAGSDTMVKLNSVSATSYAITTSGEKLGKQIRVEAKGGKWVVSDVTAP